MVNGSAMMEQSENRKKIVIPKRSFIARRICCFAAAGKKQIPRR
jgi:hypothetical protein